MQKVVIDVEARFSDSVSGAAGSAISVLERLARTKIFVKFNADSSPFLKVLNKARSQAEKFGHSKLAATLEAVDKATRVLGSVWNFGLKIGSAVWRATVTVADKATAPIRGIFRLLRNPVLRVGTALGLSFGVVSMVNTYKEFEAAMSNVQAISGATGREMDALSAKAKEMGAATKFTATEAGEAMSYMAMAGWKPQDMLDGIEGIMNLAAASGESLASTSDIVTDAITAFGKTAKDSNHFADVMAAASANANTNVSLLGESFKYVAPVAGAFGYTIEDVALDLGLMANAGVKGSQAGTALRFALSSLNSPTKKAQAVMDRYGVSLARSDGQSKTLLELTQDLRKTFGNLGVSATDSAGALKDYDTIMAEAKDSTRLSAEEMEKLSALSTIFGERALPGMLALINAEEKDFDKLSGAIYGADGAAKRMSKTMMDNLKGSLDLLKSAAEGAILTVMDFFGPHLRKGVDWLAGKMPGAGKTVGKALDFVGTKFEWVSDRIKDITESPDYKFGSIGEKVSLLWKGVVADPLSEWWNGGGREKAIETAGNIGRDLGEILKTGLLTIFGMTGALDGGSEAMSAGASIAKSFVEGFAEGFDFSLVAEKLKAALSNIWDALPGWARALTGIGIGSKVIGGLSTAALGGITAYKGIKAATGTLSKLGLALTGSTAAGTLAAGGAGAAGAGTGAGTMAAATGAMAAGTTAGAATAIGAASVAGGVAGGISILSGIGDWVRGAISNDETDKKAYYGSGNTKILGTGLGTGIGAAVGSVIPGLGTAVGALIGTGIGGIASMFAGNKVAKNIRAARYESEEMQEAIKDADMSAEDLARTFDKAVYSNMKSRFGDIELSLGEIKRLSEQMVFTDDLEAYNEFTSATQKAAESLQSVKNAAAQTDRWMWKAGLGVKFDESEIGEIQTAFNDYVDSAKAYIEDKHYEFTMAVDLLMDVNSDSAKSIIDSGGTYFTGLETKLKTLGEDLSTKVNEFLADDGKIELRYNAEGKIVDEPAIIAGLQNQIAEIIEKVANAEQDAQLNLINLKFGGGRLSLESYDSFITELQNTVNSRMSASDEAFIKVAAGLKLQYESGLIPFSEYEQKVQEAADGYSVTVSGVKARIENFAFDVIGESYKDVLGPDAKKKFSYAISQSLKDGIKLEDWTSADVEKYLGASGLQEETANGIGKMLSGVNNLLDPLQINPEFQVEPATDIESEILNAASLQELEADAKVSVNPEWEVKNVGDPGNDILALVSPDGQYAVPFDVLAEVGWTIGGDKFNPELISPDGTQRIPVSAEAAVKWTAVTGLEFNTYRLTQTIPGVAEPITVNLPVRPNYTIAEGSGFDASKIIGQVPPIVGPANTQVNVNSTFAPANKFEFKQSNFGIEDKYPADITTDITARFHPANSFTFNKSAFGIASSYQASTNVAIKVNYSVDKSGMPNISSIKKARGGIIGPRGPMGFAEGGMVRGGPQLVTVAEEGTPEMIIPLGSQRRERGMQLWRKAGHMLGVEGYANGGIAGRFGRIAEPSGFMSNVINLPDPETFRPRKIRQDNSESEPLPRRKSDDENGSSSEVSVNVGGVNVTLNINVSGGNEEEIMAIIEQNADEVADIFLKKINKALGDSFANTPALGGETA